MRVDERAARKMLTAMNLIAAEGCTRKRLVAKLNGLADVVGDPDVAEPVDDESRALLEEVLGALEAGEAVEVGEEEAEFAHNSREGGKMTSQVAEKAKAEKKAPGTKKVKAVKAAAASGEGKAPGVIGSILEFLQKATSKKPLSKKELVEKLAARFPDRDPEAMSKTVNVQVPSRLAKEKGVTIEHNDHGYWVAE